ncbi:MAG: helix-turn-helix domain-containing protein [Lachnospiraceae bacterium]|nr:helix-turn-helix domain-containing protein [Lachnospiraceae bacterium]
MLHIRSLEEGLKLFKALGSEMRVDIVRILTQEGSMSMNELAGRLGITNGALTGHIRQLEESGVVAISSDTAAGHGNQKICSVHLDRILIDLKREFSDQNVYTATIKVGRYSDYDIYPTCGLATATHLIGEVDDARYFAHPERFDADILWFTRGFVEYQIPNFVPASQQIDEICISAELSSEAPGINGVWPSDIYFHLNDTLLGSWLSPGDFGDVRGMFTPDWWYPNWNQYGLLKMLTINHRGTFMDGLQISEVTIDEFGFTADAPARFRISVPDNAEHIGGLTIFGKNFGNYRQDIDVRISYSPKDI